MNPTEFAEILSNVTGVTVKYRQTTNQEMMSALPEVVAREAAESFAYAAEFGYEGRDDSTVVHPKDVSSCTRIKLALLTRLQLGVHVNLPTVEDWVRKQNWLKVLKVES